MVEMMGGNGVFGSGRNFLESHVEDMENKPRLLTECWQKYLYWLRMSLMRVERLPAPGQILTTAKGFTIERDFLDTGAWGRGKSYEDVYQEVIDGNMFPEYWDRALYEGFTYWVQFKRVKAGYRYLIDKWIEEQDKLGLELDPLPKFNDMADLIGNHCFWGGWGID
ncbi:hypothetical protein QC762_0078940 [Podospora pseudocomata]|uniref:Uncharacterized protein n=1 Tax=Podospora pseudocomata TaxID=2093779 RepID=A0ABR0GBF1_9PEZI|nr:hypothetical protein QC762_0078940 [Podospora pseudocomata]